MSFPYLIDILNQPAALQDTLSALPPADTLAALAQGLAAGRYRRIVLTGMGSSYHALQPLAQRLWQQGAGALLLETSELIHYGVELLSAGTLVIAVSQSGRSAETVRLLELLPAGVTLIGITNTPGSPLAARADEVVLTQAGAEASVSCKTYLTALAALSWLGDALLGGEAELPALQGAPEAMALYLEPWQAHVAVLKEAFQGVRQLYLVGRGPSLATVGTGGLIIKESAHFPAEGLSSASFRHGPFEMVGSETFVVVFAGPQRTLDLNRRLAADVLQAGGRGALCGPGESEGPFALPAVPAPALPILEMLPPQMISLALAEMKGIVPGSFGLGHKVTTVE